MVDILERIHNPLARSATAAVVGASATTIIAGGLLGLSLLDNRLVNKFSIYAGAAGAGVGALFGAAVNPTTRKAPKTAAKSPKQKEGWTDWRDFVVARKVTESNEITSFYLKPQDSGALPSFQPGQFLTIKLDVPDQPRPVIRTYSLSDYSVSPDYYRLSIKREGAPKNQDVPPGIASNFMHDQIHEGAIIPCKPPAGKFVLDVQRDRPAVLISNGVGITPMISMAKAVAVTNPNRPIWFLHGARNGDFHAFREALLAIAPNNPNFTVHYRYSRPRPDDDGGYHSTGYVDVDLVKSLLTPRFMASDAEYFLCGSPSFMDSLRDGLAEWGVPREQVYFESFAKPVSQAKTAPAVATETDGVVETAEVVFAQSGKTAQWSADDGTLLEFAEAQGLSPDFSCRAGICLTCMCRVKEGEVAYEEPPSGTPDDGHALICVAKPRAGRVVLDV
ncbi:2Fe-2S iron-sulfur cluster-binding protein [Oscillatoria sp. CS-180]|uniref:2Fe-2S iron-sulfur cluster-binding protein n=1 Tax=Oscillatoria sp. CS-180 TaxID=3021720 RepID=UPI0023314296|nr:2Fe-2S iron-sulfur cluster-binding protein [Oscillatoria sp. CS-180]MDB9525794.1 2Fe-2S iron-sulfur cluster-binding protein [Oscillatoria sp. CS-180]